MSKKNGQGVAVPEGYKMTEVGVIPEDWECTLITNVARLESGHTPSRRKPEYWNGDVQWVSLHDTGQLDRRIIESTAKSITEEGLNNSSARLLPAGTVVFSRTATVGKAAIIGKTMATSQDFANYVCGPRINNLFLVYLFRGMRQTWNNLMAGSIHNTIYMPVFKNLKIPVPPLPEQRAIATALSETDDLIESLERLIAKKRRIKDGAMGELLSGERRLEGFEGEWEEIRLGDVGSTYSGLTGKVKADFGHGIERYVPFLNVISNTVADPSYYDYVDVGRDESQNRLAAGDLLFNGSSETPEEVGLCAAVNSSTAGMLLNSFCFGFRFHATEPPSAVFLAYYFRSPVGREAVRSLAQGATRYNLSKRALLRQPLTIPPLPEQRAIATLLTDMDQEIELLEGKLAKVRRVKEGMMGELLGGRVRLIDRNIVM